jgi:hypothetical protein
VYNFDGMFLLRKFTVVVLAFMLPAATLAQNGTAPSNSANGDAPACSEKSLMFNFDVERFGQTVGQAPIWHLRDDAAFFFTAGMLIDADGAPNAYNADNTGLDDLSNAGEPGHWDGLLQDAQGNPLVQGPDDPFPGYYISCTALADWTKDRSDPARFVDASKIPYIALPGDLARQTGARLGDLAVAYNLHTGKFSYAIFADIGALGEGSIALAENVGLWPDARRGGSRGGILYVIFPGSGDHHPKTLEEINNQASSLFENWGGADTVRDCLAASLRNGSSWPAWLGWGEQPTSPSKPSAPAPEDSASPAKPDAPAN